MKSDFFSVFFEKLIEKTAKKLDLSMQGFHINELGKTNR